MMGQFVLLDMVGKYHLQYHGRNIRTSRQLAAVMANNANAYEKFDRARVIKKSADFIYAAGGACLIASLFLRSYNRSDGSPPLYAGGLGLFLVAIPLEIIANGETKRAIKIYNNQVGTLSHHAPPAEIYIGLTGCGIGAGVRF